jgi:hypothetical protein
MNWSSELLSDPDFSITADQATNTNGTYWETEPGWTIESGEAVLTNPSQEGYDLVENAGGTNDNTITPGATYRISYEITAVNGGSVKARIGHTDGEVQNSIGQYTEKITASTVPSQGVRALRIRSAVGFTGTITVDNISVQEVHDIRFYD